MNLCSKNCEHVTGCVLLQKTTNFFQTKNNIKGASSDTVKLFFFYNIKEYYNIGPEKKRDFHLNYPGDSLKCLREYKKVPFNISEMMH